jgi:protein-S-isoprenylcysteine O-methyltransferase Ste14
MAPPLMFAFFWFRWEVEVEYFIWPAAIGLVLAGLVIRIWAQQHLHYRLDVHKTLTSAGPYLFVRNPIYIGNIMLCLGATVASELLWLAPITLLYGLWIYSLVVRHEEIHLREKYGESYREYLREVPRWVPKLGDLKNLRLKNLRLRNEYFHRSILAEIHCVLIMLPYIAKEIVFA